MKSLNTRKVVNVALMAGLALLACKSAMAGTGPDMPWDSGLDKLVKNLTVPARIPVICGEENMCKGGGLATLSISYFDMGYAAGELAASILKGEADPATSPIVYCSEVTREYNPQVAEAIGWTIPDGLTAIGG